MHKLTFTLKQHTPIIHFQTNIQGAAIRPTEFKSKLDRFLIGKWTGCYGLKVVRLQEIIELPEYKLFLKNGYDFDDPENPDPQAPALDYKVEVRILPLEFGDDFDYLNPTGKQSIVHDMKITHKEDGTPDYQLRNGVKVPDSRKPNEFKVKATSFSPFFGNMGEEESAKKLLFHRKVEVTVKSTDILLLNEIKENLLHFLFYTNFGTRQGKGFGSYFLDKDSFTLKEFDDLVTDKKSIFYFDIEIKKYTKEFFIQRELFRKINLFYCFTRSGINDGSIYSKPVLWHYVKNTYQNQWDKRSYKKHFFDAQMDVQIKKNKLTHGDPNYPLTYDKTNTPSNLDYMWRDALGLSSDQQWKSDDYISKDGFTFNLLKGFIVKKGDKMAFWRFKSPFHFKPLRISKNKFRVYVMLMPQFRVKGNHNNFPEHEIYGKTFDIKGEGRMKGYTNIDHPNGSFQMKFPDINFDYIDFIKFIYNANVKSYIKGENQDKDKETIENIFSQLNAQNPYKLP